MNVTNHPHRFHATTGLQMPSYDANQADNDVHRLIFDEDESPPTIAHTPLIIEEDPPVAATIKYPPIPSAIVSLDRRLLLAITGLRDDLVAWKERFHRLRFGSPSPRAQDEWWSYYEGVYATSDSNPAVYARLLHRNGIPDWPNPSQPDESAHFHFHPEGLLGADLEVILSPPKPQMSGNQLSEAMQRHRLHYGHACVCWAMLLTHYADMSPRAIARACLPASRSRSSFTHISSHVHVDNLLLACVLAAAHPALAEWGISPRRVLAGAARAGWGTPAVMTAVGDIHEILAGSKSPR